jgi:hypothetical protein
MSPDVQILLSGALTFGVPLALAIRELLVLDRGAGGRGGRDDDARGPDPAPSPDDDASLPPLPASFARLTQIDPAVARAAKLRVLEEA